MKNVIIACAAILSMASCQSVKDIKVTVTNPISIDRKGEMVELPVKDVVKKLHLPDAEGFVVYDSNNNEVPYQITYDRKLIFPVNVKAGDHAVYLITKGTPAKVDTVATGMIVPQRKDDIAWENDLVAHRAYGPALQRTGEKSFGYDVWTKNNTTKPVMQSRYDMELLQQISYHVDHGNGMDCYSVGPTLGAGTTALLKPDGEIVYPYCYQSAYIMDNGPLRFSAKLVYNPFAYGSDSTVVETRYITLDAGSHMNKTVVSFEGLSKPAPLAVGLVLHEEEGVAKYTVNAQEGYMTYTDPTDHPSGINGQVFVGAILPAPADKADAFFFEPDEAAARKATGHVLGINQYEPNSDYLYYWGSAWSKADIKTADAWNAYITRYAQQVRHPLVVSLQ